MTTLTTAQAGDTLARVLTAGWAESDPAAPIEQRLRAAAAAAAAWHAAERAPARAAITSLRDQLRRRRRELDEATAAQQTLRREIDQFHAAIRRRVLDAVNDRQICRPGANEALAAWQMPTLRVAYETTVEVGLALAVTAPEPEAAEELARQVIHRRCCGLTDTALDPAYDIDIDQLPPPEQSAPAATYRVTATLRAHLHVLAADEDDAAHAAVAEVRDRAGELREVEAFNPVCVAADDTSGGYLDPNQA